jgi:hypothetical protein
LGYLTTRALLLGQFFSSLGRGVIAEYRHVRLWRDSPRMAHPTHYEVHISIVVDIGYRHAIHITFHQCVFQGNPGKCYFSGGTFDASVAGRQRSHRDHNRQKQLKTVYLFCFHAQLIHILAGPNPYLSSFTFSGDIS